MPPASDCVDDGDGGPEDPSALALVRSDEKILLVGSVQFLFETALAVFVIQWPSAVKGAVGDFFGGGAPTPYGAVFSAFMAGCLLGSTLFAALSARRATGDATAAVERFTAGMLAAAALSLAAASLCASDSPLPFLDTPGRRTAPLLLSLVAFEVCAGAYFSCIGTLRGATVPDRSLSAVVALFNAPANACVAAFLVTPPDVLGGTPGALGIAAGALALACGCTVRLTGIGRREREAVAAAEAAAPPRRRLLRRTSSVYVSSSRETLRGSTRDSFKMDVPFMF